MGDRIVRGGKATSTDAGTHVPLIANWPGVIPPGRELDDLIDSTDFLPTICAAANVAIPSQLTVDGVSFFPQLRGEAGQPRQWIYSWFARSGGAQADFEFIMDKRFKLYRDGRMFDVAADFEEHNPLDLAQLPAAQAAKKQLAAVFDRYQSARPEAIAAQGEPKGRGRAEE
jgi:arylsulfatase A